MTVEVVRMKANLRTQDKNGLHSVTRVITELNKQMNKILQLKNRVVPYSQNMLI